MLVCLYSLIALIEYIPRHIFLTTGSPAASYVHLGISSVAGFILPALLATVALVRYCDCGMGRTLLLIGAVSLSRLIYSVPSYYLQFFSLGLDTGGAVGLSVLVSLGEALIYSAYVLLLFFFARLMHRSQRVGQKATDTPRKTLLSALKSGDVFDFGAKSAPIIFVIALASFIVNLPIGDTVTLIIDYGDTLRFTEVLSVILDVILQLVLFILTHVLCFKFKSALTSEE